MFRTAAAAILASAALLAASGATAQPQSGYYVAKPIAAPAKARLMTRDTPWQLRDGAYVAATAPVRATVLCQLLARETGGLAAFSVGGQPYSAEQLDSCNSKAGVAKTAVAKAD